MRIAGSGIVAALGQLVVDMPHGYFGTADTTTLIGVVYATSMVLFSLGCGIGVLFGASAARWTFPPIALVGMAFFLPALVTDTAVAAAVIAWMLFAVSRAIFAHLAQPRRIARLTRISPYRVIVRHVLGLSVFATALVAGFRISELGAARVSALGLDAIAIATAFVVLGHERSFRRWAIVGLPVVLVITVATQDTAAAIVTLGAFQLGIWVLATDEGPLFGEAVRQFVERPALLVVATFAGVALVGAAALTLPAAAEQGRIGALDALFTAVSATCVTGLIVVDTPTAYSFFGEAVVLLLFQIGGLGIMVLSTFGTVILGGRLTLRGERALEHVLELTAPGQAYRLVRFIVVATLGLEAIGAVILTYCYLRHGLDLGEAIWRGIFQSVSAFCNAGFSLQTDSIVMFAEDSLALGTHAVLIVLGGLGFVVLAWMWARGARRVRARAPVQVQVVLTMSAVLVIGGALVYGVLEWQRTLAGLPTADKLSNALFQSITMRTAGFNSVDIAAMRPATIMLMLTFMFVGAAPGGTAGGIKITTVAVLAAAVPGIVGARTGATLAGRAIPHATLQRAATIAVASLTVMVVSLFLLLMTEDAPFEVLTFEAVSALGTVGLSLGVTGALSATGKLIIIATMFLGRIGPLTLALALGRGARGAVTYPETRIMVG